MGLWLVATAIVVATVLLLSTNTIHGHPAGTAGHQRARTLATVRYQGAGPSCVNVWMGGNPDDPRACRPAPSP